MTAQPSDLEAAMAGSLRINGLPEPAAEYPFAQQLKRKWRFDFAYPEVKVAIEVEGGGYVQGRHSRGAGMAKDMEKYNFAALLGWVVLRFDNRMIEDNTAADTVRTALLQRGGL
jgi:very-short-patch-repair endonuclease